MKSIKNTALAALCALVGYGAAVTEANANPLTGTFNMSVWSADTNGNSADSSQLGSASNSLSKGTAVFTGSYTGAINFADTNTNSVGGFLATGNGIVTGSTTGSGLNTILTGGSYSHASLFEFSFTTTSATELTVSHDDGFSIWNAANSDKVIGGQEGPTSLASNTFSLGAGTYNLWYAEVNGLPADLNVNVPEPASMALLGAGLISMGVVSRRRKSAMAAA